MAGKGQSQQKKGQPKSILEYYVQLSKRPLDANEP